MELYRRTDEVLYYLWDPIGISDDPDARDEYYDYLGHVFTLLKGTKDGADIGQYLTWASKERMGLSFTPASEDQLKKVIECLLRYRKNIQTKHSVQ